MIAIYKYLTGNPRKKLFSEREFKKYRGHSLNLEEKQFNLNLRRGFFTVKTVRPRTHDRTCPRTSFRGHVRPCVRPSGQVSNGQKFLSKLVSTPNRTCPLVMTCNQRPEIPRMRRIDSTHARKHCTSVFENVGVFYVTAFSVRGDFGLMVCTHIRPIAPRRHVR